MEIAAGTAQIPHAALPQAAPAGQMSTMAIQWDDWEPDEDWPSNALQPCPPHPVLEEPRALDQIIQTRQTLRKRRQMLRTLAMLRALMAWKTDVDCEPQLLSCKTATRALCMTGTLPGAPDAQPAVLESVARAKFFHAYH